MHRRLIKNIVDGIVKSVDIVLAHRCAAGLSGSSSTGHHFRQGGQVERYQAQVVSEKVC